MARAQIGHKDRHPKITVRQAELEKQDADGVFCRTCRAPAEDHYEPYCRYCAMYWQDVENGLFDEPVFGKAGA